MNIKEQIGKRLKELRNKRNLTQSKFSEMINIEQNTLSCIENGKNFFTAETLENIIKILEIEPQDILTFDHHRSFEELLVDINILIKKNPDKIQEIYRVIKAIVD